jgi:hypothetical protein
MFPLLIKSRTTVNIITTIAAIIHGFAILVLSLSSHPYRYDAVPRKKDTAKNTIEPNGRPPAISLPKGKAILLRKLARPVKITRMRILVAEGKLLFGFFIRPSGKK